MPKFTAILTFEQCSRAEVTITAKTLAEAQEKADEINADEIADWNPINGEVTVESVCSVKKLKK